MRILKKVSLKFSALFVRGPISKLINFVSASSFMKRNIKYLRRCGIIIVGTPNYISPDVYFDGHDYSKITLMDGCVLSKEVFLLTHDYSIARGIEALHGKDWEKSKTPHFLKEIYVGENSFIGARTMLLPGTHVGKNCIIGAGSVVKGTIPDNSIVVGNPAKVIAKTDEWAQKHMEKHDYLP
jgi:acetyltransferase-like isoleucine patch superfamily enzyme